MTEAERVAALRLVRSENVGPVTFRELLKHYGSAAAALAAVPELSRRGGYRRAIRLCPVDEAEAELQRARSNGAQPLFVGEAQYPAPLAALDAPPPMLYVKGDIGLLQRPTIAIVGARQCSAAGAKLARQFAGEIGRAGFVIASGLARGIDAMAHQAAIDTGTVAVLAGGSTIYTRPSTTSCSAPSRSAGVSSVKCRSALRRAGRTFPAATASCPDCRWACSSSRRRVAQAASLPRGSRPSRVARYSPFPAIRSIRAPKAPTNF